MRIEFTFSRDQDYFRQQLREAGLHDAQPLAVGAVVLAVAAVALVLASGGAALALGGGGVIAVLAVLLGLRSRQAFLRAVVVPPSWTVPRHYLVTEDALTSSTDASTTVWNWELVERVDVRPNAYLFVQEGRKVFDLPRAPLSGEQEAALRSFLGQRDLAARS